MEEGAPWGELRIIIANVGARSFVSSVQQQKRWAVKHTQHDAVIGLGERELRATNNKTKDNEEKERKREREREIERDRGRKRGFV